MFVCTAVPTPPQKVDKVQEDSSSGEENSDEEEAAADPTPSEYQVPTKVCLLRSDHVHLVLPNAAVFIALFVQNVYNQNNWSEPCDSDLLITSSTLLIAGSTIW